MAQETLLYLWMRHVLMVSLCVLLWAVGLPAAQFYVAPNATGSGNGSFGNPWPLQTALTNTPALKPGDTVWLRGGTYQGCFSSSLTGAPGNPIIVRQYPGERATIDSASTNQNKVAFTINGAWAWYWGFEVMDSATNRAAADGSDGRGCGVNIFGSNTKCINLVVHDNGVGIGTWSDSTNSEIAGCISYHNGWQGPAPDRGHGHGIYAQNRGGTKIFRDNIVFNQFGYGFHIYTEGGDIDGMDLEGNVVFNNGVLQADTNHTPNYFIGGAKPATGITLRDNVGYHNVGAVNMQLGSYFAGGTGLLLERNYIAGGQFFCQNWTNVTALNNTVATVNDTYLAILQPTNIASYLWNSNHYFIPVQGAFLYNGSSITFPQWKSRTGYDTDSDSHGGLFRPTNTQVFVRASLYETNRANITVFNWGLADNVPVDVSGVLPLGTDFEVRNAQDFFAPPVLTNQHTGQAISLPMTNLTSVGAIGVQSYRGPTWPQFNVFVLLPKAKPPLLPADDLRVIR